MPYQYKYQPAPQQIRTWAEANDWINGGKHKNSHRKLTKRRELYRVHTVDGEFALFEDDIIFTLYATDIIAYHRDGTFSIQHEGHTERTTIWDMQSHCPVQLVGVPGTKEGDGFWCSEFAVIHSSLRTRPKIQKCRQCHGTGIVISICGPRTARPYRCQFPGSEPTWPNKEWAQLPGHITTTFREPYEFEIENGTYMHRVGAVYCAHQPIPADGLIPVLTPRPRRDYGFAPCWHGFLEPHLDYSECYGCNATGKRDYGSKPVLTPFTDRSVLLIDATGRVVPGIELWASTMRALREMRQKLGG